MRGPLNSNQTNWLLTIVLGEHPGHRSSPRLCRRPPGGRTERWSPLFRTSGSPRRTSTGKGPGLSFFFEGNQYVDIFRSTIDLVRLIGVREGNLIYSKSTDLNVNLTHKCPQKNIQNNFQFISGYHGPVNVTHKIRNHISHVLPH